MPVGAKVLLFPSVLSLPGAAKRAGRSNHHVFGNPVNDRNMWCLSGTLVTEWWFPRFSSMPMLVFLPRTRYRQRVVRSS